MLSNQRVVDQLRTQYVHVLTRKEVSTHLTILFSILTSVTSLGAVHDPSVARCLTMRCLDKCSSNSFCCVLVPNTKKSSPCLNTDMSTALEWYRHGENLPVPCPIAVMPFSLATSKHCAAPFFPYVAFVQNCVLTRTLVVFSWHLDHDRTKCGAVEMRSTDVTESQDFLFSRCSPLASHTSTEHDLEAFQWWRSRKRAARVLWCQLAHSLGFLRNQPCSDECIRSITTCSCRPIVFR